MIPRNLARIAAAEPAPYSAAMADTSYCHWYSPRRAAFHEAGPDGRLRLDVLADWLQDVGGEHAGALGLATDVVLGHGLTWALRRLIVRVADMPAMGGSVNVDTWPAGRDKHTFHRDFKIGDERNRPLVAATARWSMIDLESRRAVALPDWMTALVPIDPARAAEFPTAPVAALAGADVTERVVQPRWADLDLNGHVNNARQVGWLIEALAREVPARARIAEMDIAFRLECRVDDAVLSRAADLGGGRYRHALVNADTGKDIARAETLWVSAD